MKRTIYIAGRFRHYRPGGELDINKMQRELADEIRWGLVVAECGCLPVMPLAESYHRDRGLEIHSDSWIAQDVAIIEDLETGYDGILMRPGWDESSIDDESRPLWYPEWSLPMSEGAKMEFEAAQSSKLLIAFGSHGEDVVREYLLELSNQE